VEATLSAETSFAKGLRVLGALADSGPLRIETIARQTQLPVSSVYRYVRDLVAAGLLESHEGIYHPGERIAQMARVTSWTDNLSRLGTPILRDLTEQTGETSMLTVRVGRSALVLEQVESPHAMRLSFQRGSLRMLYAGASAKVVLAYAPQSVIDDVLNGPAAEVGPNTPSTAMLRRQLLEVRSNGFAVTFGEADAQAVGVAVPVSCGKEFVCGLSIAGPAYRLAEAQTRRVLRQVQKAGKQLSHLLEEATRPQSAPEGRTMDCPALPRGAAGRKRAGS